jgi:hypothetical protein
MSLKHRADTIGIAFFVLLVVLLGFRITQGADFSDESYYAIFIDDWSKAASLPAHSWPSTRLQH